MAFDLLIWEVTVDFADDRRRARRRVRAQNLSDAIENALEEMGLLHETGSSYQITARAF